MPSTHSFVRRVAGASARRPRLTLLLWIAFVAALAVGGSMAGTRELTDAESEIGEAARADARIAAADLGQPAVERILVTGTDAELAVADLRARLDDETVRHERGAHLVEVPLRGDPSDASEHVDGVLDAVAATEDAFPATTLHQAGSGSIEKALDTMIEEDLGESSTLSLPLTLIVLVLAFGALVAAVVPLALGLTAVVAGLGAFSLLSHLVPDGGAGGSLVGTLGLAVAVDYSLFYVRREREERRLGKDTEAALDAAAATVGRAIVISGLTVIIALLGLLFTGLAVFTSMALGTIAVVAISVIGSLTALPALLALLGDRVDAGRLPWRRRSRAAGSTGWARVADVVTRRPTAALLVTVCVLGTLAVPALDLRAGESGAGSFPPDHPALASYRAVEQAFPGAPETADLVVTGATGRAALERLGEQALAITGGSGAAGVHRHGDTALVTVPMPDREAAQAERIVEELRALEVPGAETLVTGTLAQDVDFTDRLKVATPIVIALVLALAFALLWFTMRSPALAAGVVGLNLLSVGATYGVLVAVFQNEWAEGLLGFDSTGTIANWLPLFAFVILFGLSMDYTIVVLERIREGLRGGLDARRAAREGVTATAGMVTSAAIVMVVVFSTFAATSFLDTKQLGVGLAVAVLLDATIVRGVALPALAALVLGRRTENMRLVPAPDAR